MDRPLVALILAGGTGTRLYPASRSDRPKQLFAFEGTESLLAQTVERAGFADETYVLTRESLADAVHEEVPNVAVLAEPEPKDTGPALTYAAHRIHEQIGDCVMCCLPSDHHVDGDFAGTMRAAARAAVETGGLVTVGIEPDRPATGYGYISPGIQRSGYFSVDAFVEKPDAETAEEYCERGFFWNAGMFAWTPTAFLETARTTELADLVAALESGEAESGFAAVDPVSVDYAVLEQANDVFVVPAGFSWDDLGTWDALWRVGEATDAGNVHLGDTLAIDAEDCVLATDEHVSVVGVSDLVVASYDGRTLVVPRDDSQRVREVVARLREDGAF
ncbi:mannose-1-phosphate guanylyltransferase [Halobacteriales archaeon Cl-PHB]